MAKPRIRAIDPVLAVSARDLQRDRRRLGQKLAAEAEFMAMVVTVAEPAQ